MVWPLPKERLSNCSRSYRRKLGLCREEQREEVSHKRAQRAQRREADILSSRDCLQPSLRAASSVTVSKSILYPLNTFPNLISVLFAANNPIFAPSVFLLLVYPSSAARRAIAIFRVFPLRLLRQNK